VPPVAPPDVVPEVPLREPVLPGELVPDEAPGPQSFIVDLGLLLLSLLVLPLLLDPVLFEAEPPGPQSILLAPDIEPAVPALVPDFPLVPVLPVPLVCAMAAVPRVSARIEAAVRRRRFIRFPPLRSDVLRARARDAWSANRGCDGMFPVIRKVERLRS
jgi:hypothetical protein